MSRKAISKIPLDSIRADYDIAKRHSRFRRQRDGVSTVSTTGDYHYRNEGDFLYSIELGRDLDRNDSVAGMIIDRLLDNILDERGMSPDPDTGDENLDMAIKRKWNAWSQNEDACDLAGEMTFDQMERMVLRSVLVDGDIFALPNESGAVELLEAHRCRTPRNTTRNVVHGVLLDEARRRLEYWFTKDEIDPLRSFAKVSDTVPVAARNTDGIKQVFHVYDPNRVSQTRGVSVFRRNADMLGMHDDIEFANLVRQQVASCFVMIETDDNEVGTTLQQIGGQQTEQDGSSTGGNSRPAERTVEGIAPGMRYSPGAGKKVEGFTPNIPGPQFFEHVMLVLRIVSANLNLPVFAVLLDASETNFSGWRGAMDQARNAFRRIQNWFIDKFHRKVYEWKVRQWIEEDSEIRAWANQQGVNVFNHTWKRPRWEYIQPVQDVAADVSKVSSLISSLRQVHARRGDDFDDVIPEIIADNKDIIRQAIEAARELNQSAEDDTERVTWREMLAIPMPEGSLALLTAERARLAGGEANV